MYLARKTRLSLEKRQKKKKKKKKERKKGKTNNQKKPNNTQTQTGVGKDGGRCLKATSVSLLSTFEINKDFLQRLVYVHHCVAYIVREKRN